MAATHSTTATSTTSNPNNKAPSPAPSKTAILMVYIVLGCVLSFFAGREPGTLPDYIAKELAPVMIVICGFLVSYSLWDCMAVGLAKHEANLLDRSYDQICSKPVPELVHLAQRVQTNQVEQLPVLLVGSISCAMFVNGRVAGVMTLLWAILRRGYATAYRNAAGATSLQDIGLSKYTIPAYFLSNVMLMASAVHAVRCLFISDTY